MTATARDFRSFVQRLFPDRVTAVAAPFVLADVRLFTKVIKSGLIELVVLRSTCKIFSAHQD